MSYQADEAQERIRNEDATCSCLNCGKNFYSRWKNPFCSDRCEKQYEDDETNKIKK